MHESNPQRWTAIGAEAVIRGVRGRSGLIEPTELWGCALYQEEPLEAVELQPFHRPQRGLSCMFSMSGELPGLDDHERFPLGDQWPLSCTDQERAFCLLQERMRKLWSEGRPDAEMRLAMVSDYAGRLNRLGGHSFIHWDGEMMFAYSAEQGEEEPLAYLSLRRSRFALNEAVELVAESEEEVDMLLVAHQSLLPEEAVPIEPGSSLCFRQARLVDQCDPVRFWSADALSASDGS